MSKLCPACKGIGEEQYQNDLGELVVNIPCSLCKGKRFVPEIIASPDISIVTAAAYPYIDGSAPIENAKLSPPKKQVDFTAFKLKCGFYYSYGTKHGIEEHCQMRLEVPGGYSYTHVTLDGCCIDVEHCPRLNFQSVLDKKSK